MSSTNRGAQRQPDDFYRTPAGAVEVLRPYVRGVVLDPCAGDGAILDVFTACTRAGIELDPVRAAASGAQCADALALAEWPESDWIVMNPPFGLAFEFVTKAVETGRNVAALLRLAWLASGKRRAFLKTHTPGVIVLSSRPSFAASVKCSKSCGWRQTFDLRDERPTACQNCGAKVTVTTTDSADYGWFTWGPLAPMGRVVIP